MIFTNFNFESELRDFHRILERVLLQLELRLKERRPDFVTLFSRSYDLAVSRNSLSKSKNREICENHGTNFLEF